jgi:hypothetical protein
MRNGQKLVFHRSFEGRIEDRNYFEIARFLLEAHDHHWVPERRAWCRFDVGFGLLRSRRYARSDRLPRRVAAIDYQFAPGHERGIR